MSLPDDFDKILSVMRSRGVSVSIILQNLAQLKALFEKQWESIVGNCDEFLYLGGNEQSTHKYVSELLGKETIDTNTYGKSSGRSGNYSTNYQISGREENTMNIFKKNNEKKTTQKLPMTGKVRKGFRAYCAVIAAATLVCGMSVTAFAASDPITVVNNLSDFIFGLIRAIGLILLGFGIVQVGLSLKSHDPSQRANGFLTLAGGIIITLAKEILTLITG